LGTGQYSQVLDSIVIGGYFLLFWHPIQYQSDSSQHHPHASEQLFSSACDLYSDSCKRLSGHRADTLLFIKHNHCRHHRVLGFFVVIAMLYTSINIGIGYWYRILGAFLGIVLTLESTANITRSLLLGTSLTWSNFRK